MRSESRLNWIETEPPFASSGRRPTVTMTWHACGRFSFGCGEFLRTEHAVERVCEWVRITIRDDLYENLECRPEFSWSLH